MSDFVVVDSRVVLPPAALKAWLVCLSAGLFFFYEFFQLNVFDVINQPLREDFHLNAAELSWMSSTYLWADILFLLPAGMILDRFSTRRVILIAMCICVIGTLGFALAHSFPFACFFHFLAGIGNAFCFLSCAVLVTRWFPPRRQALVIGSLVTMAFLGGMVAHTPFAHLNEYYGWRGSLLIDGAVGLFLLLWIARVVQDRPASMPALKKTSQTAIWPSFLQALTNRQNWLSGFYTSFLNLPIMVLCALWGASYLQVVHQLSEMAASQVVSFLFMGSLVGCPLAGWFSDSQGRRKPLMIIGALATLFTLIPLCSMHLSLSQFELSSLFFALGLFTSTQVLSYPLIAVSNLPQNTGAATGIASVLIMGGAAIGQVAFGLLMQYHAGSSAQHYSLADFQYAMWIFPLTAVAALLAVLLVDDRP